ncbi:MULTISPECIES: quinone oxidoreductase family protein [Burkholderiaceae]|uniref:quinone oxidoreductase family protein n=1 Tax=Burkholderiaceae TaxID=119060 RepID=UPI001588D8A3|nr:zinc-binding alcohol dehydrogenase family protein [Burkholderia vietnamiensis]
MKAAIYEQPGNPSVLHLAEVPDPVAADDDLLIRVEAISIEGGDLVGRRETTPSGPTDILGYAAAGEILQVGRAVTGFKVGQKVTGFNFKGSHAELRAVPAATSWLVPDGLDIKVAAAIPAGPGTAAYTLKLGALKPAETVLIQGAAGGVGLAAVQLAAKVGARVIGTGTRSETLEELHGYGLSDAIVVTADKPASEQIRALLGGNAVDLLIDNVGGTALVDGLHVVRDGGRGVIVGVFGGRNQPIDAGHLLVHRQTVIGCLLGPVMGEPDVHALIDDLLQQALRGELKVPIDATFTLAEAAAAHRRAEERGRIGRVIMVP